MSLPEFTVLDDQYAVQQPIGDPDPFGVAYLGWGIEGEEQVIIREYFPERLAQRDTDETSVVSDTGEAGALFQSGLKFFLKTASVLETIDHPNLARERASLETNGTAYRVREHYAGTSLPAALEKRGVVSEQAALAIMQPVLDALHAVHEHGLLHGGLTPDAIFLTKDRRMLLVGIRCAEVQLARKSGRPAEVAVSGFSPPEQYTTEGRQGPWTDVYAAASTLYRMITGETLPEATQRVSEDAVPMLVSEAEALSKGMKHTLLHALALDPSARPSSADAFRQMLDDPTAVALPAWVAPADQADPASEPAAAPPAAPQTERQEAPEQEAPEQEASEDKPSEKAGANAPVAATQERPSPRRHAEDNSPKAGLQDDPANAQQDALEQAPDDVPEDAAGDTLEDPSADPSESEPPAQAHPTASAPPPEATDISSDAPEESLKRSPEETSEEVTTPGEAPPEHTSTPEHEAGKDEVGDEEASPSLPLMDRGPRKPDRKKQGIGRKVALTVGAVVLLASLGGAVLLFAGSGGEVPSDRYAQLRAAGDSLFRVADYEAARRRYTEALKLQPDDVPETEYLKRRLERIGRAQASLRKARYERQMARGDSLRARAEMLLQQGNETRARDVFAQANEAYLAALESRPSDSLAYVRAQAMNRRVTGKTLAGESEEAAAPDPEAMRDQLYERYRQRGDELLAEGNYAAARRKYREALGYHPGDTYAQARLDSIRALVSKAERARQFTRYRERGDELFAQGRYRAARREYVLALDVKPDSPDVQARIEQIDSLQAEAARRRKQYAYLRAQGDVFFGQEQYEKAIAKYEKALSYQPEDAYVQKRLAEAERRLAAIAEEVRRERMMENGVYVVVDQAPKLIGGLAALHEEVKYPQAAIRRGTEGRVIMSVVVGPDGRVQAAKVVQGIGEAADEEALRVVRQARFEPALVNGKPVPARHSVWIRFNLEQRD